MRVHGVRADEGGGGGRGQHGSGRQYAAGRGSKPGAAAVAVAPTVIRAVGKETPQERLKRLMAAQLNKKIQKDSLTAAQVGGLLEAGVWGCGGAGGGGCMPLPLPLSTPQPSPLSFLPDMSSPAEAEGH